jgi:hypothetical protein
MGFRSRSRERRPEKTSTEPRNDDRDQALGTHHALSSQNEAERKGTSVHGERTTRRPGQRSNARRARRPRASEVGSTATRCGF